MALAISTFSNATGAGSAFFKAAGHPLSLPAAGDIVARIRAARRAVAFDPQGTLEAFSALHSLTAADFAAVYVQDLQHLPDLKRDLTEADTIRPITELAAEQADLVFIPVFDADRLLQQTASALPPGCEVLTLDSMRLPPRFLADPRRYLNPLNFATNMVFFRDRPGLHTQLVTANYWSRYGAAEPFVWCRLYDGDGTVLADFEKPLGEPDQVFRLDSAQLRRELGLPEFCGQLFVHVARAAGHDIVKYVADIYGDDAAAAPELSCTHDANPWPADLYAGVPAPGEGEQVLLWVQNSHPAPIPAGAIGFNRMGDDRVVGWPQQIAPFETRAIDLGALLPDVRWPAQIEVQAGRHFVRPRYEVLNRAGRRRINHANVERGDLSVDPNLPHLSRWLGKGYILPAPVLPRAEFICECLPTPMSTAQQELPLAATVYNSAGEQVARRFLGRLRRDHRSALNLSQLAEGLAEDDSGHIELTYDFAQGGAGDGWMHALFRYTHKSAGHQAETSFGAHIFNQLQTYRGEPQSYKGPPPGLTTRLFLRLAPEGTQTFCQLIYPVSTQWRPYSDTELQLHDSSGRHIADRTVRIAAGGSALLTCEQMFQAEQLAQAAGGYVIVRDATCRLFGYHGVRAGDAFALDHMFGF